MSVTVQRNEWHNADQCNAQQNKCDGYLLILSALFNVLPQTSFINMNSSLLSQINLDDVDVNSTVSIADRYGKIKCIINTFNDDLRSFDVMKTFADVVARCKFCNMYYEGFPTIEIAICHIDRCSGKPIM